MNAYLRNFLVVILVLIPMQAAFSLPGMFDIQTVDIPRQFTAMGNRSSAMDANSHLHAAYGGKQLYYATNKSGSWVTTIVDTHYLVGAGVSIALDSSGHPHISYYDMQNQHLKYVRFTGTAWQAPETVDHDAQLGGDVSSLALDSDDHPHIIYYDGKNEDLKYAFFDGSGWTIETVASEGDVGKNSSLALDQAGHPHISYADLTNENLKYISHNGTT
ncbi:MAG: hypothetical protein CSA22_07955 [Deltaproteobacteria bacterium]|nr:MAG: hypothetical protein CSA22_07955 [Deltaproteobacteria bacterium]